MVPSFFDGCKATQGWVQDHIGQVVIFFGVSLASASILYESEFRFLNSLFLGDVVDKIVDPFATDPEGRSKSVRCSRRLPQVRQAYQSISMRGSRYVTLSSQTASFSGARDRHRSQVSSHAASA